jgi:hypothetical protein
VDGATQGQQPGSSPAPGYTTVETAELQELQQQVAEMREALQVGAALPLPGADS